jgi:hypothetical protein
MKLGAKIARGAGRSPAAVVVAVAVAALVACGGADDTVNSAQANIVKAFETQSVYERGNLPDPLPANILGYFDITERGAYRYIVNEDRSAKSRGGRVIAAGDSIAFMFDARVFTSGAFDSQQTFYTNIDARIKEVTGNNPQFDTRHWPNTPLRIKVGDDPSILKALQEALIKCVAGDGNPENDRDGEIASDQVRVYLTPNIAFGNRVVYSVPANSTIVFEVTDIEIIE